METLNATEAKRVFGDVLIKAQRSPISINKNGKPVAVIMSSAEYQQLQEMKENQLKAALQQGVEDLAAGRVIDGKQVMTELRQSIT
ncbi:MAG TPA: antitoxin [Gammaproteobacteria bacterium]|jgi:prevent-host-death family protein|nr:antitoxin [Gammaproteobacteria bacterium]